MEFTTDSLGDGIVVIRGDGRVNMVSGPAHGLRPGTWTPQGSGR
jgi:hypothetical protein